LRKTAYLCLFAVLLLGAVLLCSCSHRGAPLVPGPVSLEIQVVLDPKYGATSDEDARNIIVEDAALTWAEFSDYMKELASRAPIERPTSDDEDPRPYRSTRITVRADSDAPVKLLQYALILCVANRFDNIFWGLRGDALEYRVISPESVDPYAWRPQRLDDPFSVPWYEGAFDRDAWFILDPDTYYIDVWCARIPNGKRWAVNSNWYASIEGAKSALAAASVGAGKGRPVHVSVCSEAEVEFGDVISAIKAAYELKPRSLVVPPPLGRMDAWPDSVRNAVMRIGTRSAAVDPIIVEIVSKPVSSVGDYSDYESCLLVDGIARTWVEFAQYFEERAEEAPPDPETAEWAAHFCGYLACPIPVRIHAGRETPTVLVQCALMLCIERRFLDVSLCLKREQKGFPMLHFSPCIPRLVSGGWYGDEFDAEPEGETKSEERNRGLGKFSLPISCRVLDGRPYWTVDKTECYDSVEMGKVLREVAARENAVEKATVAMDASPDAAVGALYDAYAAAYAAGFQYFEVSPPMIPGRFWPKGMLKACRDKPLAP